MSVEENLELGAFAPRARGARQPNLGRVYALFPALRERRRQTVRAHRAYVLESGRIVGEGSGAPLLRDAHVRRAYLGPLAAREG